MNLHHLVLERAGCKENVNDLELLDRQRMQIDILNSLNLAILHKSSKLCGWNPFLFLRALTFTLTFALTFTLSFALAFVTEATAFAEASLTHVCNATQRVN